MPQRGRIFRTKRRLLNLSYGELARFLGVTEKTIRNWEAGQGSGNHDFEEGVYDGEILPLLRLLPKLRGLAFLPAELKARLLALQPLLTPLKPPLACAINSIIADTLVNSITQDKTIGD